MLSYITKGDIMKIFNEENGIKKVYVQMNDIMMLNQLDELIPASIYEKIFTNIVIEWTLLNLVNFMK